MKPTYEELAQAARDYREKQKNVLKAQKIAVYSAEAVWARYEAWAAAYTLDEMLAQLADNWSEEVIMKGVWKTAQKVPGGKTGVVLDEDGGYEFSVDSHDLAQIICNRHNAILAVAEGDVQRKSGSESNAREI